MTRIREEEEEEEVFLTLSFFNFEFHVNCVNASLVWFVTK